MEQMPKALGSAVLTRECKGRFVYSIYTVCSYILETI